MKKNMYIRPVVEIIAVQATCNLLGASKPFTSGGGSESQEQNPMY